MDFSFLAKAVGIVFRESFEAVLIYGIIVSYFQKHSSLREGLKAARWGLVLGVIASVFLGMALASSVPFFSAETFSYLEIAIVFGGSMMMLYMVFWMSEHARHLKHDIESGLQKNSYASILGTVFVAVFREGVEAVVYLYSLVLEKPSLAHRSSVLLSLVVGVTLAFIVYRLMLQGSKYLSMRTVFRISALWLLVSASSLLATTFDKIFAAGFLEKYSQPLFSLPFPESWSSAISSIESIIGIRAEPSLFHLVTFLLFWIFIIYKDPLRFWRTHKVAVSTENRVSI